jgi:hypothetical protein
MNVTRLAAKFGLDEVGDHRDRQAENAGGGVVDLAQGTFSAAVDAWAGAVAGARAEMAGDEGVHGLRSLPGDGGHAGADFTETAKLARPVAQQQRVEDIEAQYPRGPVCGAQHVVQRREDLPAKPAVAQKGRTVRRFRQFRSDGVEPDEVTPGGQDRCGVDSHGMRAPSGPVGHRGRTVPRRIGAQACHGPPPGPALCLPFKTGNRLNRG